MRIVIGGLLGAVLLLTGMVSAAPAERLAQREDARPPRLKLTSTAFRDAGPLPLAYTCYAEGGNAVSPLAAVELRAGGHGKLHAHGGRA